MTFSHCSCDTLCAARAAGLVRARLRQTRLWRPALLLALCSSAAAQYAITEYAGVNHPFGIAAGPDGNLWFTEELVDRIGSITTGGVITEYSGLTAGSHPFGITTGPDGALWFTEMAGNRIGQITTAGVVTEYSTGLTPGSQPYLITVGPDGALWFTEMSGGRIGRITTDGVITEYSSGMAPKSQPYGITAGPDGALWFTENAANQIGRITTDGTITTYSAGLTAGAMGLAGLAAGPDGNLWFTESTGARIGSITTAGFITEYSVGMAANCYPVGIAAGPDGALWFTEGLTARIGRITTDGTITEHSAGMTPGSSPYGIAAGPDGALWFAEDVASKIGRIAAPVPQITAGGVLNAASYLSGPVSPGEIISIFGTSLGPTAPATLMLDPVGTVSTLIGGVTVTCNGYAAPLTYVSSSQINAIVPYEVAGNSSLSVQVITGGLESNTVSLELAESAPGIFTENSSGQGAGAILNGDSSLNTQAQPAAPGSTIQIFVTGEGMTNPAQPSGTVTPVNTTGAGPLTPAPQLAVSVTIGNQPAPIVFAGEAPYSVAGVLQVNAVVPATLKSGANPIAVQIGTQLSQSNVTVWVK